jgi:hypothetical protein
MKCARKGCGADAIEGSSFCAVDVFSGPDVTCDNLPAITAWPQAGQQLRCCFARPLGTGKTFFVIDWPSGHQTKILTTSDGREPMAALLARTPRRNGRRAEG